MDSVDARAQGLIGTPIVFLLLAAFALALVYILARQLRWSRLLDELPALAALGGANLLFFYQPLFTAARIPTGGGDLASFTFPLHIFASQELQAGRLPFWDPRFHGGMPFLANQQAGALYPPNIVAWLLARPYTYSTLELLVIGHVLLISVGTYLLARSLGQRPIAALTAGIVFAYSGSVIAHAGH